jgi:DNA-binding LytR/AlgR family response regulator
VNSVWVNLREIERSSRKSNEAMRSILRNGEVGVSEIG